MKPAWTGHPAFAPYASWLSHFSADAPPEAAMFDNWARERNVLFRDGEPLRFALASGRFDAITYEASIAETGVVPLRRGDWHDVCNALAWLAFPRTKAALNAIHVRDARAPTRNGRTRARDAATLLDECGMLFACDDPALPGLLRQHAWRGLFVERAGELVRHVRVAVVGHGLLDRLRRPYRALTAKVLVLECGSGELPAAHDIQTMDALAARVVGSPAFSVRQLLPLPVAALPGWDNEHLGEALFDDRQVFRAARAQAVGEVR